MKLIRLSLAAILTTGFATSSFAGDSLSDAFANGKFKGELKAVYVTTNKNNATGLMTRSDESALNVGGELAYTTDYFNGLKLGATIQTTHNIDIGGDKDIRSSYATTNLSEAFIEYKFDDKTSFKGGRQYMYTPLIFTVNNAWMTKESFETYNIKTTAIPNTTILAGVMTKYLQRDAGVNDSDTVTFDEPIYHVFAKNNSIPNLTLVGQALYTNGEDTPMLQTEIGSPHAIAEQNFLYTLGKIDYKLPISTPVSLRASYYNVDYDTAQDADKYILGGSIGLGNFKVDLNYGKVSDEAGIIGAISDSPSIDDLIMQSVDSSFQGMESWVAKVHVNMENFGFKDFKRLTLVHGDFDSEVIGLKFQQTSIDIHYQLDRISKGLWSRIRFENTHFEENLGNDMDENQQEIRMSLVYKF